MYDHKVFFPLFSWNVHRLESLLKRKSLSGYRLVAVKGWRLFFAKSSEKEREYFVYVSPAFEKHDRFLMEYYCAERAYALRKSPLTKGKQTVFEVDERKKDALYPPLYRSRDWHYGKYYAQAAAVAALFTALPILCALFSPERLLWILSGIEAVSFLYFLFCAVFFGIKARKSDIPQK